MRRLAITALLLLAACERGAEPARELPADLPSYDAAAAYDLIEKQVAFGPRVPGTAEHTAQLEWMTAYLKERADTVVVQRFEHPGAAGAVPMANVFARFRPDAEYRLLLVAHWDTRPTADMEADSALRAQPILGANDGASGVAALLQLSNVLRDKTPPIGVDILLVDGEDWAPGEMYLGATHFALNQPQGYAPMYGIVVDMIADQNPVFMIEPNSQYYAPEVVERVWGMAAQLGLQNVFQRRTMGPVEDDHIPLNQGGIRTIDIIDLDYGPNNQYWHTHQDILQHTSPAGLEAVARVLIALIYSGG